MDPSISLSSIPLPIFPPAVRASWNVMAHAQKPDFVFRRNGQVHLNRRGRQVSRLLAAQVCASAVVMLDTPCSEVVWRVLTTQSIRQFPPNFPSRAAPCAITFQLESTNTMCLQPLVLGAMLQTSPAISNSGYLAYATAGLMGKLHS